MNDILYLCNRKNPKCSGAVFCGEDCKHTQFEQYALNGVCKDPENDILRFEKFDYGNGNIFYNEREIT